MNSQVDSEKSRKPFKHAVTGYGSKALGETTGRRIRRMPLLVALLGLLLIVAAGSVAWVVNRSMHNLSRIALRSMLAAHTTLLEMWLGEMRRDAKQQSERKSIRQTSRGLLIEHTN